MINVYKFINKPTQLDTNNSVYAIDKFIKKPDAKWIPLLANDMPTAIRRIQRYNTLNKASDECISLLVHYLVDYFTNNPGDTFSAHDTLLMITLDNKSLFKPLENVFIKIPSAAAEYAERIMQNRWPEAESTIITNASAAYHYSFNVLKKRWPEAEHTMQSLPHWHRHNYNKYFNTNVLSELM